MMSWILLFAACFLMCAPAVAAPPEDDSDRSLIELQNKNLPLPGFPNGSAVIEIQETPDPRPWLVLPDTCYCIEDGRQASGTIDELLSDYEIYAVNQFVLAGAWYRQAVGCTRDLLDQGQFSEAVSFAQQELTRARAYRSETNLSLVSTSIEANIRRLLIEANLLGCD